VRMSSDTAVLVSRLSETWGELLALGRLQQNVRPLLVLRQVVPVCAFVANLKDRLVPIAMAASSFLLTKVPLRPSVRPQADEVRRSRSRMAGAFLAQRSRLFSLADEMAADGLVGK
jgi:hypothetical protein